MRFIIFSIIFLIPTCVSAANNKIENIEHIVIIYLENHGFDNLYGQFPGANGLQQLENVPLQTDLNGKPYATLPPVMNAKLKHPDERFPKNLPNKPFAIDQYVPADQKIGDLVHRYYQNQAQIHGGLNDHFAAISDAGGLVMGYYDGRNLPLWKYAQKYTLADNFFQGAFGGSFLNHFWLICACTPHFNDAPDELKIKLDASGNMLKDGNVTPDGYAVNTLQPSTQPYFPGTQAKLRLPLQTMPTIGDRLNDKQISWAWYSGGWKDAVEGNPSKNFQFHHQPFGYFSRYAEGTTARAAHLKDEADFEEAIKTGTLPSVSFYKPIGDLNEHPGYADVISGEQHIADLLARIEASNQWKNTVVIVTYDENGGFWDHVAPPVKDRWGPGNRVPALIISPFAKRGFIDHSEYNTSSILKFIESQFELEPLGSRDTTANNLSNSFEVN
jgi:phospholipase C